MGVRILDTTNIEEILGFERSHGVSQTADPADREFEEWHASWRRESLEHYLPLGWSFGIWTDGKLQGYFLAQPQLFTRALTQTLWVEHLRGLSPETVGSLVEIAYKIAREKHFQKVLFRVSRDVNFSGTVLQLDPVDEQIMELKTAKF